jgi:hypothetical protein
LTISYGVQSAGCQHIQRRISTGLWAPLFSVSRHRLDVNIGKPSDIEMGVFLSFFQGGQRVPLQVSLSAREAGLCECIMSSFLSISAEPFHLKGKGFKPGKWENKH